MSKMGRICSCFSGLCVYNPLCDYSPLKRPFDSSSGIDINQYERTEHFNNINKANKSDRRSIKISTLLIIIILIIFFILIKVRNL